MTLRTSINNLIRGDRPESPTDLIFIFGMLVLIGLQIWATLTKGTVAHFGEMLLALGGYKGVKVASNFSKKGEAQNGQADKPLEQI
jgi:hypothetical protein